MLWGAMNISSTNARVWLGRLAAACTVMSCVGIGCAQDLRYLSQQAWSTEEGLPQSSVHAVLQTRDGYLWIATEGGVARFDGVSFKVFAHADEDAFASDDICCLAQDAGDGLWIGTADGLVRMERGEFRRFGMGDGLPSATVVSLEATDDGSVAVQTDSGWARWEKGKFRRMSDAPVAASSIVGRDGARWSFSTQLVSVAWHGANRAWRVGNELPVGRVQTVVVNRAGPAWVGMNDGLFVLDVESASATMVKALGSTSVLSIYEDAEGNDWIGTETSGLHVLRRLKFRSEPGLADKAATSAVQTKDGAMWVGTRDDGLSRVRNGVVDAPVAENRLTSAVILCLAADVRGGLWVGTPDGLNHVASDGKSVQRITSANGLPDDYVRSLAASADGSVWVGTRQGLAHLRGDGSEIKTLTSADGLGGDMIGSLLLSAGRGSGDLWAGTSGGLSRVSGDGAIKAFTIKDGLAANIVTAMALDGAGDLWVATRGGGLSLFDGRRFIAVPAFASGTGREGNIEGISADGVGTLWFRMDHGIRRIALTTLHACVAGGRCPAEDGIGETFGLADGLPNDEVVAGGSSTVSLASNGELWFPTRGGVAIIDTKHVLLKHAAPPVVLERFLVDDASEDLSTAPMKIAYGHARFTMEYAGLSFTAPTEVRYRFRLFGFDEGWTYAGGRRSATYTNLAPGWYRFEVEAMNAGGEWSRVGAELRFRIVPPFYRRWWFVGLVVLALCGLLGGLYLLRLRRLRGRFDAVLAERNRMAREIHDTLTQDFVGTSLQLDLISQQLSRGKVELAMDQVRRTRQLVTEGLDEARRSIWELRANNSQDSLPTRLTKVVEREQFAALKPRLHIGGAYREVEARVERELLRIAQEALTNVLHHARATEVSVDLHYSSDTLMLTVVDNGLGFSVDDGFGRTGHYGLLGMKERASLIDGALEIASEPGHGTKITLRVPITLRTQPSMRLR
jgi:ligand-binding sensor domain-containing protein/signal transduction histidine kinase